jgi:pyruvate/2-oxoacid:ferredoxin oxidoreductase beta subunit
VANALAALAVRQCRGGRHRSSRSHAGEGAQEVRTIAQGGDGGTTDIGFGCLSGMFERNDDVL